MPGFPHRWWIVAGLALALAAFSLFRFSDAEALRSNGGGTQEAGSSPREAIAAPAATAAGLPALTRTSVQRSGLNVADLYKSAFALFQQLSDSDRRAIADTTITLEPAAAAELSQKVQPIMELIRRAAKEAKFCDWSVDELDVQAASRSAEAVQALARTACWEAEQKFSTDAAGALADLNLLMTLGQSLGFDGRAGLDAKQSFEAMAVDKLRLHSGELSPDDLVSATNLNLNYDPASEFRLSMTTDALRFRVLAAALENPATQQETIRKVMGDPPPSDILGMPPSDFVRLSTWIAGVLDQLGEKAFLPEAEFQAWKASLEVPQTTPPIASSLIDDLNRVRSREQEAAVNQALLGAGLAMLGNDGQALARFPDPTTGKPFSVTETENGFELQAQFLRDEKPMTMTFPNGRP